MCCSVPFFLAFIGKKQSHSASASNSNATTPATTASDKRKTGNTTATTTGSKVAKKTYVSSPFTGRLPFESARPSN